MFVAALVLARHLRDSKAFSQRQARPRVDLRTGFRTAPAHDHLLARVHGIGIPCIAVRGTRCE